MYFVRLYLMLNSIKVNPKISKILIIVVVLFMLGLAILFIFNLFSTDISINRLPEVEAYLGEKIPSNALDVIVNGEIGHNPHFRISFKAPPESISQFMNSICEGILHQGYNPFKAIDTAQIPPQRPYLIKMQSFTYFSYSTNTPDTVWGNRCWPFRKGLHQILVDKGNPNLYELQLDIPESCEQVAACSPIGKNYIEPIADIPFIAIGMVGIDKDFILVSNEFCLETQLGYDLSTGWTQVDKWKYLIGAKVQIWIDEKPMETAYISNEGRLTRMNTTPDSFRYDYCFTETLEKGTHSLTLRIEANTGQNLDYSWNFLVK